MLENEEKLDCLNLLKEFRGKGKSSDISTVITVLQTEAKTKGLEVKDLNLIVDFIINNEIGAVKCISLIKCLIPRGQIPDKTVKDIMIWCFSSTYKLSITVSTTIVQWIIGVLYYQLAKRKIINAFYDVLFHTMLTKEKLEKHIACLIHMLAKPEDVTRRDVSRLLVLQRKHSQPQKHIIALLSLFKSYKPELVPEKIQSINIESVWRPIPDVLRVGFEVAKDRIEKNHVLHEHDKYFNWNIVQSSKRQKTSHPLMPSVGYFQIGSSIFKEKDAKSIFDVRSMEELGKYHVNVDLPCNATSLLTNMAGYHLLTYANFRYQSRFSYNLYYTLRRAFLLECGKFSKEEKNRLLEMTLEFSRYMQQGIPVTHLFINEYLCCNSSEYQVQSLALLQWMTHMSINELQETILRHVETIYFDSELTAKCEIIRKLKMLIMNIFVQQGFKECRQTSPAPFLGQGPMGNLVEVIAVLTKLCEKLIISGLNAEYYNAVLLSEAISFYEEISVLQNRSDILTWTIAPPAVIYGGFIAKNLSILSRTCTLLTKYHEMTSNLGVDAQISLKEELESVHIFIEEIVRVLWHNEGFSNWWKEAVFFKDLPKQVLMALEYCNLGNFLSIDMHYAVLPYIWTLRKTGLDISTTTTARSVSTYYYPALDNFLATFVD